MTSKPSLYINRSALYIWTSIILMKFNLSSNNLSNKLLLSGDHTVIKFISLMKIYNTKSKSYRLR